MRHYIPRIPLQPAYDLVTGPEILEKFDVQSIDKKNLTGQEFFHNSYTHASIKLIMVFENSKSLLLSMH